MKAIIVHGWGGTPKDDWYSWAKEELEKRGWEVEVPGMPNTASPKIEEWVSKLKEFDVDENTYLIGHSMGCQAILRYLEKGEKKVGGCLFVAGWFNLTDNTWDEDYTHEIADPWLRRPINFEQVKNKCSRFVDIVSNNDPYVPVSDSEIFKEKLGADIYILNKKGHISGEDGVKALPIIIEILDKWINK